MFFENQIVSYRLGKILRIELPVSHGAQRMDQTIARIVITEFHRVFFFQLIYCFECFIKLAFGKQSIHLLQSVGGSKESRHLLLFIIILSRMNNGKTKTCDDSKHEER